MKRMVEKRMVGSSWCVVCKLDFLGTEKMEVLECAGASEQNRDEGRPYGSPEDHQEPPCLNCV